MFNIPGTIVTQDSWWGTCPVQGVGTLQIEGQPLQEWYFRARGVSWSVVIGEGSQSEFEVSGPSQDQTEYAAGYMSMEEGHDHLRTAVMQWASRELGGTAP